MKISTAKTEVLHLKVVWGVFPEAFCLQACLPKQIGEDELDDLERDGPITLGILNGIAWDFTQAK